MANKYIDENLFGSGSDIPNLPLNFKHLSSQDQALLKKNFCQKKKKLLEEKRESRKNQKKLDKHFLKL